MRWIVLGLVFVGLAWMMEPDLSRVSPSRQTHSKFLESYDPTPVVNSFKVGCGPRAGWEMSRSGGASAGDWVRNKNVKEKKSIESRFCADPATYPGITASLHADISTSLISSGCQLDSDRLSADEGIRIAYHCGKRVFGLVTAPALKQGPKSGVAPRIAVPLHIQEEWIVRT